MGITHKQQKCGFDGFGEYSNMDLTYSQSPWLNSKL